MERSETLEDIQAKLAVGDLNLTEYQEEINRLRKNLKNQEVEVTPESSLSPKHVSNKTPENLTTVL